MIAGADPIAAALIGHGYLRGCIDSNFTDVPRKEWLHFVVQSTELDLIVNFSCHETKGRDPAVSRYTLACVARTTDGRWHGDVEEVPAGAVRLSSGRLSVRYGVSVVRPLPTGLCLRVRGRTGIEADLTLEPRTFPMFAPNVVVDGRPSMHWFAVPRMTATGRVRVGNVDVELRGARAYHDHNWGEFRWGGDFGWNWGFVTPSEASQPWSLVLLRLTDRARSYDSMRSLTLWNGEHQARVFQGAELDVDVHGFLRVGNLVKLPRALALLSPGCATDVPRRLVARAVRGSDWVEVELIARDAAQFVVPNDVDLGSTLIHEVVGTTSVRGRVDGSTVAFGSHSVFEFVGG